MLEESPRRESLGLLHGEEQDQRQKQVYLRFRYVMIRDSKLNANIISTFMNTVIMTLPLRTIA